MKPRFYTNTTTVVDHDDVDLGPADAAIADASFAFAQESSDLELRRDYQHAVDCLIQCDALFKSFQEQLRSKDERIEMLEGKVMELSLELASVKAGQDYQKLKTQQRRHTLINETTQTSSSSPTSDNYRRSWTSSSSSHNSNGSSGNKLLQFGQFIKTWSSSLAETKHYDAAPVNNDNNNGVQVKGKIQKNFNGNDNNIIRRRRLTLDDDKRRWYGPLQLHRPEQLQPSPPPHTTTRRRLHRSPSSEACLDALQDVDGVIFPVSSFEVYSKGCCKSMDDRMYPNSTTTDVDMQNVEWPTFH